ncbi:MAG: bile acid:sodium symporter [Candidatus Competibacteraceae bacterium]|nr:bile acid:sodium symporter [Candidatus Competibacteraceae bacterium]
MTVILFKIAMVIFIVGSLLDMGLRLNPRDALKGLRNFRFVLYTLLWGFVFGPTLAYVITLILPLDSPYAMGLLLIGMTPCTSLLPVMVNRAKGDLGYTAAFMLLASGATIIFMPFAVPFMLKGLTVSAWTIAKPLLMFILLPMVVGIAILHGSATLTSVIQPFVKKATGIAAIAVIILCLLIYGEGLLGVAGSLLLPPSSYSFH